MKRGEWMRLSIAVVIAMIFIGTGAARLPVGKAAFVHDLCPATRRRGAGSPNWSATRTGPAGGTRWQRRRRRKGQYAHVCRAAGRNAGADGRSVHIEEFL